MNKSNLILSVACLVAFPLAGASAGDAVRTGVFVGDGPRANGMAEYLRLVADSPELDLTLLDADDIRSGALDGLDLLIVPGGDSRTEKRDLGVQGAERIREFLRKGGGYIGSCAGCCLLMDEVMDPERGIGIVPFHRTGSKGGYMMPVKVNEKGAKALGVAAKTYKVRYHGGPVLEPSTNSIPDARFEIWGTYEHGFGAPGKGPKMVGRGAMVGGTYGKGRVFAFAVHPENYPCTRELVHGAFRYVAGREVTFPERKRKAGSPVVGWYSNAVSGKTVAKTMLEIDALEDVDLFPLDSDDILHGMLDHVDLLVVPDGNEDFYRQKVVPDVRIRIAAFRDRGGRAIGWGAGARVCTGLVENRRTPQGVLSAVSSLAEGMSCAAKRLKVLVIGNSFSVGMVAGMPPIAKDMRLGLDICSLYIGGCSLRRHWLNVCAPTFRPYSVTRSIGGVVQKEFKGNIPQVLKGEKWDVVTIQQASHLSWKTESYSPFGDDLVRYVRANAPGAKIFIQETWSYTPFDKRLAEWGIDQNEMYAKLHDAYVTFARRHGLEVIPTGSAVQLWRRKLPVKYAENSLGGDVVGSATFEEKDGGWVPKGDVFHMGKDGNHLQSLVWTAKLFGVDVTKCAYVPETIDAKKAELLRAVAMEAVADSSVK